jgi:hypothetical protein
MREKQPPQPPTTSQLTRLIQTAIKKEGVGARYASVEGPGGADRTIFDNLPGGPDIDPAIGRELRDLIRLAALRGELSLTQQARLRDLVDAVEPAPARADDRSDRTLSAGIINLEPCPTVGDQTLESEAGGDRPAPPLPRSPTPSGKGQGWAKASPRSTRSAGWVYGIAAVAGVGLLIAATTISAATPLWWLSGLAIVCVLIAGGYYFARSDSRPSGSRPRFAPTSPPTAGEATNTYSLPTDDVLLTRTAGPAPPPGTATHAQGSLNVAAVSHPPARTLTHGDTNTLLPDLVPVLDKYAIVRHLGEGSFGTVFLAHPKGRPDDLVAIKFFVYGSTRRWRQLQAEVQRLAGLDGVPGIVGLIDVHADADPPHFVMRFAGGGSLADRLRKEGRLPAAAVARLAGRIAAALAAVHQRGVVHCDLKPANVLLDESDQPLLADFGQAQLVGEDAPALGTLFYMPPDQADPTPRPPDPRWDVYALGALLHALLTGRPPHQGETLRADLDDTVTLGEKLRRYRTWLAAAPPPEEHRRCCPDGRLCGVIDRCLCVDPASRYPDAAAVLAGLSAST